MANTSQSFIDHYEHKCRLASHQGTGKEGQTAKQQHIQKEPDYSLHSPLALPNPLSSLLFFCDTARSGLEMFCIKCRQLLIVRLSLNGTIFVNKLSYPIVITGSADKNLAYMI